VRRILVTGNAGSGKTTLSRRLAATFKLELHGLDSIVWKPGWKKTPAQEKQQKINALVSADSWIIDGVSQYAFLAADTIFFLDIPLHRCISNILIRFLRNGPKTRETLPPNCPEYLGVFKAIQVAFAYQRSTRPFIVELIENHREKKVVWIRSYSELEQLLA
jgi:adenylate kinase family enzyme